MTFDGNGELIHHFDAEKPVATENRPIAAVSGTLWRPRDTVTNWIFEGEIQVPAWNNSVFNENCVVD